MSEVCSATKKIRDEAWRLKDSQAVSASPCIASSIKPLQGGGKCGYLVVACGCQRRNTDGAGIQADKGGRAGYW